MLATEMNERCAAGTGAALDRCLHRLGLDEATLAGYVLPDAALPRVSARCGVFAEANLVSLVRSGVPAELILGALLDAVVHGNLAVLARGRPLPPQVVLLGGPHAFAPALATLWRRRLAQRWAERGVRAGDDDDVIVPPDALHFAAEGALLSLDDLRRVTAARGGPARLSRSLPSVGVGVTALPSSASRSRGTGGSAASTVTPAAATAEAGPLTLGLDAGSTTLKAVVLDERDELIVRLYRKAERGPLEDAQRILAELAEALGARAGRVAALGVTGYAADVIGPVLGADAAPVETLAHARAAARYVPEVDVVCDVGGQDIKVLLLADGAVTGFHLSSQCAAGNGALLEATAAELGVPLDRYAEVALAARRTPDFAVGCAVFLDTERVTCQRDGASPAEILAGMAAVLPRNVWEGVVAAPSIPALGQVFVLSGGVQRNQAAREAQIDYLRERHPRARILVHPYPGEAGAIGAALAAREAAAGSATRFVGFARVSALRFAVERSEATRCHRCPAACPRTFVAASTPSGERIPFVTGHACERGSTPAGQPAPRPAAGSARNLLRVEAARLFAGAAGVRVVSGAGRGLRVALPRVLSMYRSAPFFLHYLEAIGVARAAIVTGEATGEELWRRAAGRGTADACFPVKVAQAHVADLLARRGERPFDVLFFPVLTHAVTAVQGCADTASCPVVAGTPLVVRAAFGADAEGRLPDGTLLLTPTLVLTRPALLREQLFAAARRIAPALTLAEHDLALQEARAGQRAFERALEEDGAEALRRARAERRTALVLLGRPYHADPGIHHDLGSELWALGRTTLSLRALPKDAAALAALGLAVDLDLAAAAPSLTNSGAGEKLAAARLVAAHPYLAAIEISSFKCGQDASLYGAVADLARRGGKPFLALHDLDETRPVGSLRLRLRTFLDALERYERVSEAA